MERDLFDCFCDAAAAGASVMVLLICAHPDDETIGAGARLGLLDSVHLAYTTDGAPSAPGGARSHEQLELTRRRRAELHAAMRCGGVIVSTCTWIGFADQELSHNLVLLTRRIHALISTVRPDVVVTHAYEGGHPDHDATAFAVAQARRAIADAGQHAPSQFEFASYHAYNGEIRTGCFLNDTGCERAIDLGPAERERKRRMLDCYASQRETLQWFGVERECFRPAPIYDFTAAPHDGPLFYDYFDWGVNGRRWRDLATHALRQLQREAA